MRTQERPTAEEVTLARAAGFAVQPRGRQRIARLRPPSSRLRAYRAAVARWHVRRDVLTEDHPAVERAAERACDLWAALSAREKALVALAGTLRTVRSGELNEDLVRAAEAHGFLGLHAAWTRARACRESTQDRFKRAGTLP